MRFPQDRIERIPVAPDGVVDLGWLEARLVDMASKGERALVSVQAANNETGVLQPVRAVADLAHAHGGLMHCDAVQAIGKVGFDVASSGADLVAVSAHKIGGPQGVGALAASSPSLHIAERVLRGGGQERGLRAGTENAPGVAGFGAAAREARLQGAAEAARMARLRDRLEAGLRELAPDVVIFSSGVERLANTTLFALPGQAAETALIAFDLDGVALSSGSACSSGKVRRSHVLQAMGVSDDLAGGAVRVSLGWSSVEADVERFLQAFEKLRDALHLRQGRRAA